VAEFTGERVVPGKVDVDLWNEHLSRYLFASRLCRSKKVIDLGCGAGYGSFELAQRAESVIGVDISESTILEARQTYQAPNLQYEIASLDKLPFADASFQLGVCFEVIEHLDNYRDLLAEARRVLAPSGQLVISTPNLKYYAESRKRNGANPFHSHEFEYEEFRQVLGEFFEHQTFFVQNHASGLVFLPLDGSAGTELRLEASKPSPTEAHFFIAVCAAQRMMGSPAYVYMPTAANVLRERERHIERLESELVTKNEWLDTARNEHKQLVDSFRMLQQEMESKNKWALEQNQRIAAANQEITRLGSELDAQREGFQTRITELEAELEGYLAWGRNNELQLEQANAHIQKLDEEIARAATQLAEYQKKLDEAEALVIERTRWAQNEQKQREAAEAKVAAVEASRWIRMGKAFGLGPKFS
jgi:SAM-dependent methyltransferase